MAVPSHPRRSEEILLSHEGFSCVGRGNLQMKVLMRLHFGRSLPSGFHRLFSTTLKTGSRDSGAADIAQEEHLVVENAHEIASASSDGAVAQVAGK